MFFETGAAGITLHKGQAWHRVTAIFVVLAFTFFDAGRYVPQGYASPDAIVADPAIASFSIPKELGKVEEFFRGTTNKTVIFIQDAHDSLEAQENISRLIGHFVEKNAVRTVFEEGYEGPVPTNEYFGFIQDPELKRKVAYFFLDHLRIGGAEYAHINRVKDFKLIGADSIKLHKENIDQYRLSSERKEAIAQDLRGLSSEVRSLADKRFSKELLEWLKLKTRFDAKKIDLLDYLGRTMKLLAQKDALSGDRLALLRFLLEIRSSNDPNVMEKVKHLDAREIYAELIKLEEAMGEAYLKDATDKEIFGYYKVLGLLNRLNELQVSQEEYEAVKMTLKTFSTESLGLFVHKNTRKALVLSRQWENNVRDAIRFYEIAKSRDQSIGERLDGFIKDSKETIAVLVFGGFHKENIKRILESKGIAYQVVSPRITSQSPRHEGFYKRLMTDGRLSYELPTNLRMGTRAESQIEIWNGNATLARTELRIMSSVARNMPSADSRSLGLALEQGIQRFVTHASARSEVRGALEQHINSIKVKKGKDAVTAQVDFLNFVAHFKKGQTNLSQNHLFRRIIESIVAYVMKTGGRDIKEKVEVLVVPFRKGHGADIRIVFKDKDEHVISIANVAALRTDSKVDQDDIEVMEMHQGPLGGAFYREEGLGGYQTDLGEDNNLVLVKNQRGRENEASESEKSKAEKEPEVKTIKASKNQLLIRRSEHDMLSEAIMENLTGVLKDLKQTNVFILVRKRNAWKFSGRDIKEESLVGEEAVAFERFDAVEAVREEGKGHKVGVLFIGAGQYAVKEDSHFMATVGKKTKVQLIGVVEKKDEASDSVQSIVRSRLLEHMKEMGITDYEQRIQISNVAMEKQVNWLEIPGVKKRIDEKIIDFLRFDKTEFGERDGDVKAGVRNIKEGLAKLGINLPCETLDDLNALIGNEDLCGYNQVLMKLEGNKDVQYLSKRMPINPAVNQLKLNRLILELLIRGTPKSKRIAVIVTSRSRFHKFYVEWALEQGHNVLVDKPLTSPLNWDFSNKDVTGMMADYYSFLKKDQEDTLLMLATQKRYNDLAERILHELKGRGPIDYMNLTYNDGYWVNLTSAGLDYSFSRPKDGGKLAHSGYHFFDLIPSLLQGSDDFDRIVKAEVTAVFQRPADLQAYEDFNDRGESILDGEEGSRSSWEEEGPSFRDRPELLKDKYHEINANIQISFKDEDGNTITAIDLGMFHGGPFSKRTDDGRGLGRVKTQVIHIHQSTAKINASRIAKFYVGEGPQNRVGGRHSEMSVKRSGETVSSKPVESGEDDTLPAKEFLEALYSAKNLTGINWQVRSSVISHAIGIKLMAAVYQSVFAAEKEGRSKIVTFEISDEEKKSLQKAWRNNVRSEMRDAEIISEGVDFGGNFDSVMESLYAEIISKIEKRYNVKSEKDFIFSYAENSELAIPRLNVVADKLLRFYSAGESSDIDRRLLRFLNDPVPRHRQFDPELPAWAKLFVFAIVYHWAKHSGGLTDPDALIAQTNAILASRAEFAWGSALAVLSNLDVESSAGELAYQKGAALVRAYPEIATLSNFAKVGFMAFHRKNLFLQSHGRVLLRVFLESNPRLLSEAVLMLQSLRKGLFSESPFLWSDAKTVEAILNLLLEDAKNILPPLKDAAVVESSPFPQQQINEVRYDFIDWVEEDLVPWLEDLWAEWPRVVLEKAPRTGSQEQLSTVRQIESDLLLGKMQSKDDIWRIVKTVNDRLLIPQDMLLLPSERTWVLVDILETRSYEVGGEIVPVYFIKFITGNQQFWGSPALYFPLEKMVVIQPSPLESLASRKPPGLLGIIVKESSRRLSAGAKENARKVIEASLQIWEKIWSMHGPDLGRAILEDFLLEELQHALDASRISKKSADVNAEVVVAAFRAGPLFPRVENLLKKTFGKTFLLWWKEALKVNGIFWERTPSLVEDLIEGSVTELSAELTRLIVGKEPLLILHSWLMSFVIVKTAPQNLAHIFAAFWGLELLARQLGLENGPIPVLDLKKNRVSQLAIAKKVLAISDTPHPKLRTAAKKVFEGHFMHPVIEAPFSKTQHKTDSASGNHQPEDLSSSRINENMRGRSEVRQILPASGAVKHGVEAQNPKIVISGREIQRAAGLKLTERTVAVVEKKRIETMSRSELRQLMGFAAINREKLWLVVPDMLDGNDSQFLTDLRSLGVRISSDLPEIARDSKVQVIGFSDKDQDTVEAFQKRLSPRLAKGVKEYFALEGGEGVFLALLVARPEDLPVKNGFRYDKTGRYQAELHAVLKNLVASYFVISSAA